jgi:acyl-ACP thioesterase
VQVDSLSELVAPPPTGRIFSERVRPGFADCAPSGRVRLDALARWLQDIAYADVEDAGLEQSAVWVVRRTGMRVNRFPRFGGRFTISTFCSGIGRMWAERRTTVTRAGESEGDVEAVSLWVHLDPVEWRPVPLGEREIAVYGGAAAARRVTARLRHPAPESIEQRSTWTFRATECDIAGHVNNAAYWAALEEELLATGDPQRIDAEIEYRTPAQPGEKLVLRDGARRWIVSGDGDTHASMIVADSEP